MTQPLRISIDGPTSAGKTTLGLGLATHFGTAFLDTGLTYRALAFVLSRADLPNGRSWKSVITHVPLLLKDAEASSPVPAQSEAVLYRGNDITDELWGFEVDNRLDLIARDPVRRNEILDYHHEILKDYPHIVVAGRDIATSILRNATLHVFLTANFAVRRERRRAQHLENPTRSVVVGAITQRDIATLNECRQLDNGVVLDTTYLPTSIILSYIITRVNEAITARSEE